MQLLEGMLPDGETGMYYVTPRGFTEVVKKVGNRFYYFSRLNGGNWMPLKKSEVKYKDDKKIHEEQESSLLTIEEQLFISIVESINKPQILQSYAKRVLKSEGDIKSIELHVQKTGQVYLVLRVNGKDIFFNEVDDLEKLNKSKDTFVKYAKELFKDFNSKYTFKFDVEKLKFDVDKYNTHAKVSIK